MFLRFYFDKDLDDRALDALLRDARLQFISDLLRASSILATDKNIHISVNVRKLRSRAKNATQDIYLISGSVFAK